MFTEISTSTSDAVGHLQDQEQRVLQLAAVPALARDQHPGGHDLLAEHPAHHVDLVHRGVGDGHLLLVEGRHARRCGARSASSAARRSHRCRAPASAPGTPRRTGACSRPGPAGCRAPTSASTIRRQASCVVASGFSQNTGLPAAIDARTYCSWVGPHEQTTTASTAGIGDQLLTGGVHRGADTGRHRGGGLGVDVGDGGDLHPGQHRGHPPDVVLTDHAGPDDSYPDVSCVRPSRCPCEIRYCRVRAAIGAGTSNSHRIHVLLDDHEGVRCPAPSRAATTDGMSGMPAGGSQLAPIATACPKARSSARALATIAGSICLMCR